MTHYQILISFNVYEKFFYKLIIDNTINSLLKDKILLYLKKRSWHNSVNKKFL